MKIILLLLLIIGSSLQGLDTNREITQFVVDRWTDKVGLPQNNIEFTRKTKDNAVRLGAYARLGLIGDLTKK